MATASIHREKRQCKEGKKARSNKHSIRKSIFGELDKTKEYAIYWLCDNDISTSYSYEISRVKLRGIVDYLRKISHVNDIKKMDDQNVFLVVDSASLDKHFVQSTNLNQIHWIYVYEDPGDKNTHKNIGELFAECPKVRGPFKDLDELFLVLSKNVRTMICQPNMASELPPLTSASNTVERSTSTTYSYVTDWYIHLIRALEEVPPTQICKEKFIEECYILYEQNPSILKVIQEFRDTYVSEEAIRWYTRDGFLYKVLNRVLREQNQQAIQVLHFLIYDLDRQLKNELRTTKQEWMKADTVHLYRGQLMSMEEVQQLRKNKGEELFVNSFLSMTTDLAVANMFSGAGTFGPTDPIQSVIFHIEWADSNPKQGLADIHRLSFNEDEGEVLLSPTYTVNLLDCVYDEKERVWNATFSRISQTDNPLIRINDDERLMRLELTLRHLTETSDSSNDDMEEMSDEFPGSQNDNFDFTRKFCSTFVEDVPILLRELKLPELCSVTLNEDYSGRFELKTLRSFTVDALDHGPDIRDALDHGPDIRDALDHGPDIRDALDHGPDIRDALDHGPDIRDALDHGPDIRDALDHGPDIRDALDHGPDIRDALDHGPDIRDALDHGPDIRDALDHGPDIRDALDHGPDIRDALDHGPDIRDALDHGPDIRDALDHGPDIRDALDHGPDIRDALDHGPDIRDALDHGPDIRDALDHGPDIRDEMVITLYDALGSVFKTKGKLMEAYFYYQKASMYDQPQLQTSCTRQAHLAQIHKINGDYELAWNIFDELMNRANDTDNFLYEDIAFARSTNMSNEAFLQNSHAFLQYCSANENDDDDMDENELFTDERISYVIDAWAELGYKYFYQNHDGKQALECYAREKELSLVDSKPQSSYFNPLIGSCSERMGDVYASQNDTEIALNLYKEALDLSLQQTFVTNIMTAARCMCKIGRYSLTHEPGNFHRAFQQLLYGYGKPYTRDTIGKCYVYLSRSLQRSDRHQQAFIYAKQALSIFLPDPLLLEGLIDNCCQLLIELHRCINGDKNDMLTKEGLLNDRISLNDEQIKEMLQTTLNELESEQKS